MKYIPADKLIAEIMALKEKYGSCVVKNEVEKCYKGGRLIGYEDALNKISKLQQEQLEVDLDREIDLSIRLMSGVHSLEDNEQWYKGRYENIKELVHQYYELGLNARKEE